MRLPGRSNTRKPSGRQPDPAWAGVTKNPVFYPPTPARDQVDARPGRLMARLRAALLPRGGGSKGAPESPAGLCDGWVEPPAPHLPHPPRLVARSPVREASISADLCALAGHGFTSRPARADQALGLPGPRSLSAGHRRGADRARLAASVYIPTLRGDLGGDLRQPAASTLAHAPRLGPGHRRRLGLARSVSLTAGAPEVPAVPEVPEPPEPRWPPLPPLPDHLKACCAGGYARSHRGSGSSGSTAAPSVATPAGSPTDNEGSSIMSGRTRGPHTAFLSPQQAQATCLCAEHLVHGLLALDTGAPESRRATARRRRSEGFSDHAGFGGGGGGGGLCVGAAALCVGAAALPGDQRAVYMRNSCADSELVKSTFDLAKLLPSAPL
ncbi:hypothetical protein H4R18_003503 [Coemansia javaensis]|uniref:Uncharacterized protein n=1 Tax=Coemansia javaensis TaxID=2761396 RepID=A0A9W8HDI0_9FUNG|nr:hypothetical protein H4R18_003503 [Coemansia javaensis]